MLELVYKSKAKENISQTEIDAILETAQNFNKTYELTGCLIFHNNSFIQLLEGDENEIRNLYTRIINDTRHNNVELLYEKTKTQRNFDNWVMAFINLDENEVFTKKLFKDNLTTYAEITPKITKASNIFWKEVKELLQ
ncbi:MAG: BLUF domain-containing protein [Crocinitomicaceae bacterium]|nr:BLUF domain-containing protein [Crocinitomicaceae bacterium]